MSQHRPGHGGLTVGTTSVCHKPALSAAEVMSNEGPHRERREHCCVQTVGLAVLHVQCTLQWALLQTVSYRVGWRAKSLAGWLQWKACLEAVMKFSGEQEGMKLCAG